MSLRNKKSSLSLSRQSTASAGDMQSNLSEDYSGSDKDSRRIEKRLKRMSLFFQHKAKTEDFETSKGSITINHIPSTNGFTSDTVGEIAQPHQSYQNSIPGFYSHRNGSSGTIARPSLDIQSILSSNINNVEFNNVRSNSGVHDSLESLDRAPGSAKSIEGKLGRFLSKTGHKVKKLSDLANDNVNSGLGLQTNNNTGLHGWSSLLHYSHSGHEKDLKSPISRAFPKSADSKLGFSEKLKLLNATKYKNTNYHNLLRSKKDKGIKLGSKVNELMGAATADNYRIAGASAAFNGINYNSIDQMCNSQSLSFEQCDQYCNFLVSRLQQMLVSLFKGEGLAAPMEDLTKLTSMYVRLRKCQEKVMKSSSSKELKKYGSYNNVNDCSTILENDTMEEGADIKLSASQNSLKSITAEEFHPFETPYLKSNGFNNYSPLSVDIGSPSVLSPMMNIRGMSYSVLNKILEELKDILKANMNIMISQLYYDKNSDRIKFTRGVNILLNKRKNTLNSSSNIRNDEDLFDGGNSSYGDTSYSISDTNYLNANASVFNQDIPFNQTSKSVVDLPMIAQTDARNSILTAYNSLDDIRENTVGNIFETFGESYDITNGDMDYLRGGINQNKLSQSMLSVGILPVGRFERCINVLWDIFQHDIMFELTSIMLPVELEFANGHRESSKKHIAADAVLFNNGEKIWTFTNTNIHPDISGTVAPGCYNSQFLSGTLGEWTDINIRNVILIAFRDNVVIPLYEMNRELEDVKINNIEEYADVCGAIECFQTLAAVSTGDTNQKLVENLIVKLQNAVEHPVTFVQPPGT